MDYPDALPSESCGSTVRTLVLAALRLARTALKVSGKRRFLVYGKGLHLGANVRLWAPDKLQIGDNVYIGTDTLIECNATIGNHCLIANRVAFLGRHDHDFRRLGFPVRFSPWIGDLAFSAAVRQEEVVVSDDVWVGYCAILLTGITVGRGAIIAAGAVVTKDVEPYAIVAGNPARKVGERFKGDEIKRHEEAIERGRFIASEKGFRYCVALPYFEEGTHDNKS
jgi:acetyltransferase-like isoleucine patch superfamily enzyme